MKSNKSSGGVRVVNELAIEMRQAIVTLAGERSWTETRQRWLERAARRAGITYRSARALFYCEPHQPRAAVVDQVRAAVSQQKREEAISREELAEMRTRIALAEARFDRMDAEFFHPTIEAFRQATSPLGAQANGSDRRSDDPS